MKRSVWLLGTMALALCAGTAEATQQGVTALGKWKTMDLCARLAQSAYPDFNPESNAKRSAQLNACLYGNNLPPREPPSTPNPR
jgi:hypothetical protein